MQVKTEQKMIPEHIIRITSYIAEDGKIFYNEPDCLRYEQQLSIQNHPVFKSCINNVELFNEDRCAKLYYFRSKEDHDFFLQHMGLVNLPSYRCKMHDDFECDGWYLYWSESDDYSDTYYIQNYQRYIDEIKKELISWEADLNLKMTAKMFNIPTN